MMIGYLLLIFILAIFYFLLLRKYGALWDKIQDIEKNPLSRKPNTSVSILIPFRNESHALPRLIQSLNQLDINDISVEVVFINDHSSDSSCDLLSLCELPYSIHHLDEKQGKKSAIELGWEKSKGDVLFQTDADCVILQGWLQLMLDPFNDPAINFVSGPVVFMETKNFWQKLVTLDFMSLIAIGAAHISWNKPLMCNGANMAYRRSLIANADIHIGQASGDDVFLLQSSFRLHENSIQFCKNKQAVVETEGPKSLISFWNQRLRWASKNSDYDSRFNTFLMIGIWLFNFVILGSLLSFSKLGVLVAFFLLLIKTISELNFYSKYEHFMGVKNGYGLILLGQLFHILYMAILPPLSQVVNYKWKARVIK
jgi:biofilm PGA synthesis N-glycosyltransferase PgaC